MVIVCAVCAVRTAARADEHATSAARPEYEATDHLLMWAGRRRAIERGFVVDVTYSLDTYAAPQLKDRFVAGGLLTLELDVVDRIHVSAFAIHGGGVTNELGDLHGTSGNTAERDVRVFEAWIDQPIGPAVVRAGLLAADQEFVLADHSQLLLGATFGITSQFSANLLGPVYPIASPGVSARVEHERVGGRIAVYDGTLANAHGIPTRLGPEVLLLGELTLLATFKLGAWHHTTRGDAVYAVLDRKLLPDLGVFARAGHSPNGKVATYLDAGVRVRPRGFRPADLFSIGLAHARAEPGDETAVELSYEVQIRWLSIQPDLQLILMRDRTVGVMMTRLTVTL
ncbi:MAG: hypothetical protein KF773_31490 [Deltaproteobacteria bacterium]|nr:hypothetical protein [Deltaproteobacteria bacterium]